MRCRARSVKAKAAKVPTLATVEPERYAPAPADRLAAQREWEARRLGERE